LTPRQSSLAARLEILFVRAYAITFWPEPALGRPDWPRDAENKKADVVEAPKAFDHVGLLVN
jgi:hypothetical protein